MQTEAAKALTEMRGLATMSEIRSLAAKEVRPALKVNAHLHLPPNFSAFQNVAQMVDLAALVEALLREIATALANREANYEQDND